MKNRNCFKRRKEKKEGKEVGRDGGREAGSQRSKRDGRRSRKKQFSLFLNVKIKPIKNLNIRYIFYTIMIIYAPY